MAYRREFGAAVLELIGDTPYRTIARDAEEKGGEELSPAYIADIVQGRIPRVEKLAALAKALDLSDADTARLMTLAGYANGPTAATIIHDGLNDISRELGRPVAVNWDVTAKEGLTPEEARALVEQLRQQAKDGLI